MDSREFNSLARNLQLLTVNNPKLLKNTGDYLLAILHLAPAWESGHNTCPMHTKACAQGCLYFAGRGAMGKVKAARIRRTKLFFEDRRKFFDELHSDIWLVKEWCHRVGKTPAFRLNGTSDIRWERHNIPQSHSDAQFYDYTKLLFRTPLPNYHLTYSFSGVNLKECLEALKHGMNVAVPFLKMPALWHGWPVVDGDTDDLRFTNGGGNVIGLKAKGPLRRDPQSPFLGDNHV